MLRASLAPSAVCLDTQLAGCRASSCSCHLGKWRIFRRPGQIETGAQNGKLPCRWFLRNSAGSMKETLYFFLSNMAHMHACSQYHTTTMNKPRNTSTSSSGTLFVKQSTWPANLLVPACPICDILMDSCRCRGFVDLTVSTIKKSVWCPPCFASLLQNVAEST